MDSGKGRKRPWEEDSPIDSQFKRRGPSTATTYEPQPPLPQHAGHYSRDSETLSQRRLPPLYTPVCSASAGPLTTSSIQLSPPVHQTGDLRPRSQSLFDVSQQPARHWYDSASEASPRALGRDRSLPPIGNDAHQPRFGTDAAPNAAGEVICCPPDCTGQECSNARTLMRKLAAELVLLDSRVRSLPQSQRDYHSTNESPDFKDISVADSLQWVLDLVQWTNVNLRDHIDLSDPRSPVPNSSQPDTTPTMRRGQHHLGQREEQSPPIRPYGGPHHGFPGPTHPTMVSDPIRSHPYSNEIPPNANSPHYTASSSGSMFVPPQSPMQAPQASRPGMLPSPSSMNFPNVSNLPPISPPSTTVQTSAQSTHLQDLQHQVSVKTLAFQTLQREYDSLLQKLERQRTKCATLEKKFEVSDVEINSLTDEKEKLQGQVAVLECQVEELQQSRDEARHQLIANGAQYMRIMEMANRLQAQSADDKKRWEAEKTELRERIKVLEEAMVTGLERPASDTEHTEPSSAASVIPAQTPGKALTSSTSTETVNVLRAEVGRLRLRTQTLETALQIMKEESLSIQEAAKKLVESGDKIEKATHGALGG